MSKPESRETPFGDFVVSPLAKRLAGDSFAKSEVCAATGLTVTQVEDAVSRFGLFVLSDAAPPATGEGRRFHYFDALALFIFCEFRKAYNAPGAAKTLISEVSHLLFGDAPVSEGEAKARKAEVASKMEAGGSTVAKMRKHLFSLHEQRRREMRRDPFSASPLWWSRDSDRNFALFGRKDFSLFQLLADRNVNGGKIDPVPLLAAGMVNLVNVTGAFGRIDEKLAAIVAARHKITEP